MTNNELNDINHLPELTDEHRMAISNWLKGKLQSNIPCEILKSFEHASFGVFMPDGESQIEKMKNAQIYLDKWITILEMTKYHDVFLLSAKTK